MRTTRLHGALQSLGITAAFVVGGLAWAGVEARARAALAYPAGVAEERPHPPEPPAIWLVDGFNVLCVGLLGGRERDRFWNAERRAEVVGRAERFDDRAAEVWVVFDGRRPGPDQPGLGGRVREVFAESADEWLVARVKRAEDPSRVAVVTADRKLAARARHRGARVVSPQEFLGRCGSGEAES